MSVIANFILAYCCLYYEDKYIYIYRERERERERQTHTQRRWKGILTQKHIITPLKSASFPHPPTALSDDGL